MMWTGPEQFHAAQDALNELAEYPDGLGVAVWLVMVALEEWAAETQRPFEGCLRTLREQRPRGFLPPDPFPDL